MGFMGTLFKIVIVVSVAWLSLMLFSEDPFNPQEHVFRRNMIITGASSGIGRETAIAACEMGANVFITARREKLLKEVLEQCRKVGRKGAKHGYFVADMSNMNQAKAVVEKAAEMHGGIEFLILNHGHTGTLEAYRYRNEDLVSMRKLFDTNYFSMVHMTNVAMPHLIKSHGKVAVVSSVGGEMSGFYNAPYAATKFTIGGFFGTLEHENYVKQTNVSFTVFVPGAIDTPMLGKFFVATTKEGIDVQNSLLGSMAVGASPRDCGYALIRSTALRETKPYFPDSIANRLLVLFGKMFPELNKQILRYVANNSPTS